MRKPVLVVEEAIVGELHRHRGLRFKWVAMKSAMPLISSRWKIGRDSASSPGRSEATATISGALPASGCRDAPPSLRISIFGNGSRLKPSTKTRSQGRRLRTGVFEGHFRTAAKLMHQAPSAWAMTRDPSGACLPQPVGVPARLVDIEALMRVLDGGDGIAALGEFSD